MDNQTVTSLVLLSGIICSVLLFLTIPWKEGVSAPLLWAHRVPGDYLKGISFVVYLPADK